MRPLYRPIEIRLGVHNSPGLFLIRLAAGGTVLGGIRNWNERGAVMAARKLASLVVLALTPVANAQIVVELVPNPPGPYVVGQSLTVDVWLHSELSLDVLINTVQLGFGATDPMLSLDPTFTFDFASIPLDIGGYLSFTCYGGYEELTCFDLPVPRAVHQRIHRILQRLNSKAFTFAIEHMDQLSPDQRMVARLMILQGRSLRTTATQTQLKLHQVRQYLHEVNALAKIHRPVADLRLPKSSQLADPNSSVNQVT